MLSRPDLLETLHAQADSLRLANVFRVIAVGGDLKSVFESVVGDKLGEMSFPIREMLADEKRVRYVSHQLSHLVLRTAVTQAFELTRRYCRNTNQVELLKAQPWFHLIRLVRNAFDHDFHFDFGEKDLPLFPASWGNVTLTADLQGVEITHQHFSTQDAIAWLNELEQFVSGLK